MGERESIFLVDDTPSYVDFLQTLLKLFGHKVVLTAGSAVEVETLLGQEQPDFTVAIVDNRMPRDGDGKKAAQLIREKYPEVKIVSLAVELQNWGDINLSKKQDSFGILDAITKI
jgi:DNA-binding NtrC family response regulator